MGQTGFSIPSILTRKRFEGAQIFAAGTDKPFSFYVAESVPLFLCVCVSRRRREQRGRAGKNRILFCFVFFPLRKNPRGFSFAERKALTCHTNLFLAISLLETATLKE